MSASKSAEAPVARAARGVGRAIARLGKQVENALSPLELSVTQYRVLGTLAEGSAASSALASRLAVSRPSVTALIDGLVARGLVERRPHPTDRRRLDLELTEAGRSLFLEANACVTDRVEEIAAHFGAREGVAALRALERWNDALDAHRDQQITRSEDAR